MSRGRINNDNESDAQTENRRREGEILKKDDSYSKDRNENREEERKCESH